LTEGGCRFGIVLNGSPLFTGGAGSGESEIRRYVLENDLVEAIIGLPTDMFYNTGISTYVWICQQPETRASPGQGAAHRRLRHVAQDAQEPWAPSARKWADAEHIEDRHPAIRRLHSRRRMPTLLRRDRARRSLLAR
jgi:type I restriction-modification system DNA methylase subunit